MPIPVYPEGLPLPLREGYAFTPVNRIRRTNMDSGRARQRVEFRSVPTIVQLAWILNPLQAQFFEAWAAQVVGAGWFTMVLVTPLGFDTQEVRFTESPVGGELVGRYLWKYRVGCELRTQPLLPPGWVELLPSFILNPEIFDYAMNREWPLENAGAPELLTEAGAPFVMENDIPLMLE